MNSLNNIFKDEIKHYNKYRTNYTFLSFFI